MRTGDLVFDLANKMCGIIVSECSAMNDGWSVLYENGVCEFAFYHELELISESR